MVYNKFFKSKILFLATISSHIYYFRLPFMNPLKDLGYEVEVVASNVGFTEKIGGKDLRFIRFRLLAIL